MTISVKITVEGITPLIMNKFNNEESLMSFNLRDKNTTPREIAETCAYKSKDGTLYVEGFAILKAIIEAGRFHKDPNNHKKNLTNNTSSTIPAYLEFVNDICSLNTKEFEVDSRSEVIPSTKGRVMKYRPRLDKWKLSFEVKFEETSLSEKLVRSLIDDAGTKCGLLEHRPNRKGMYGKFKVIKWEFKKI